MTEANAVTAAPVVILPTVERVQFIVVSRYDLQQAQQDGPPALARVLRKAYTADTIGEARSRAVRMISGHDNSYGGGGVSILAVEAIEVVAETCDCCPDAQPLDTTDLCPKTGIQHGEPCHECKRRGVHLDTCPETAEAAPDPAGAR